MLLRLCLPCVLSSSLCWLFVYPSSLNPSLTSMLELNHPSPKQESLQILVHQVPKPLRLVLRYVVYNDNLRLIIYLCYLKAGVVIASPSATSPNYLYTWVRDSSLVLKFLIDQYVVLFWCSGHL